ncbi:MAG: MBL fold metallo-hydrolase [Candidatus Bathyarchaeales archaeon]
MVEIKILSGSTSIGGNFIRIEDGDRTIILDQGIRFDLMSRYYSGFIAPRGVAELRSIGALPKPEWYEGASAIYISHMHLDHLGALSNIPRETKVKLPSTAIYEDMEEKWGASPTWLSLIPRKYYVEIEELQPLQTDENNVMALPVSHSAHPAYAFIYFGKNETMLYTGDFRIESFLNQSIFRELNKGDDMLTFLEENKDIKIDTLIIEGTNIGSDRTPITPTEASKIIEKLAKNRKQLLATLHSLDVEYAYMLVSMAEELKMRVAIASAPLAKLLEKIPNLPSKPQAIDEYVDYLAPFPKTPIENVEEKTLIMVSYREIVDLIRDLNLTRRLSKDCLAIISEPEPQIEEGSEYSVIANWFSMMGIESYRIRSSGHYYQYQLKTILKKIKPKKCIKTIHTEKPKLFLKSLKEICKVFAE